MPSDKYGCVYADGTRYDNARSIGWIDETELLSFLALEGCPTQAKFDALMAETCADRLRVASAALTARHDELSEKAALRAEEWL